MNANAKRIYPDSDEKLAVAVTVYEGDDGLFYDEECTKSVSQEEAVNLFKKGLMLIAVEDGFLKPSAITIEQNGKYTVKNAFNKKEYYALLYNTTDYALYRDPEGQIPVGINELTPDDYTNSIVNIGNDKCIFTNIQIGLAYIGYGSSTKRVSLGVRL